MANGILVQRNTKVTLTLTSNQVSIEEIEEFLSRLRQLGCDTKRPMVQVTTSYLKAEWPTTDPAESNIVINQKAKT